LASTSRKPPTPPPWIDASPAMHGMKGFAQKGSQLSYALCAECCSLTA
jgi:hypothetical protein